MSAIRIANAPCSWGVVKGVDGQESLNWLQVLNDMRESGYAGTELGDRGFMPNDAALILRELTSRDLTMVGAFVPVRLWDAGAHVAAEATALRTARLLAAITSESPTKPFIILADDAGPGTNRVQNAGRIRPEDGLSHGAWKALAAGTERLATVVREQTGLRTVFHHHCGTFVETPEETARLLDSTPADLIGLCLDTGHYIYGGGDPLEVLRRYRDRVWHVHFKDVDGPMASQAKVEGWDYVTAIRNGIFCGIGEGAVDHAGVFDELTRTGYDGWIVVENEAPPGRVPPLLMAQRDRDYMRGLGA